MARGAIVKVGVVAAVVDAASDLNLNYGQDTGVTLAFVPDPDAQIGDLYSGGVFTYLQAPVSVTLLQAKKQLTAQGIRAAFEAKVALASQNDQDEWNCMQVMLRSGSVVTRIAAQLLLTSTQIDTFFRNAAKL